MAQSPRTCAQSNIRGRQVNLTHASRVMEPALNSRMGMAEAGDWRDVYEEMIALGRAPKSRIKRRSSSTSDEDGSTPAPPAKRRRVGAIKAEEETEMHMLDDPDFVISDEELDSSQTRSTPWMLSTPIVQRPIERPGPSPTVSIYTPVQPFVSADDHVARAAAATLSTRVTRLETDLATERAQREADVAADRAWRDEVSHAVAGLLQALSDAFEG